MLGAGARGAPRLRRGHPTDTVGGRAVTGAACGVLQGGSAAASLALARTGSSVRWCFLSVHNAPQSTPPSAAGASTRASCRGRVAAAQAAAAGLELWAVGQSPSPWQHLHSGSSSQCAAQFLYTLHARDYLGYSCLILMCKPSLKACCRLHSAANLIQGGWGCASRRPGSAQSDSRRSYGGAAVNRRRSRRQCSSSSWRIVE